MTVIGGENATLTSNPFVQLGGIAGVNMAIDNNEIQVRDDGAAGKLFLQRNGGDAVLAFGGGQVGIGTSNPQAKLTIIGGADVNLSSNPFLQLGLASGINMAVDNNEIQVRDDGLGGTLFLQKDGGDASLVSHGGRVAIGKNVANATLDVDGAIHGGGIFTNSTRIEVNDLGTGDRNAFIDFHGSDVEPDFSARMFRLAGENGDFRMENRGAGNLAFRTSNTNRAIVKPDGKFLIGLQTINTPGNYKLYVEDGILTERVKIATINSADWADYVFEEDYKMHSFKELKAFVQEHKHLPNVPSAQEVEENGYELHQMDIKLLEKIEELYLLTIQLNEEKDELAKENKLLKESLSDIIERLDKLEK